MGVTFFSVLSLLWGKNPVGGGCSAGSGLQNKLAQFQPAATCQRIPAVASDSLSGEARNVPNGGGGWPVGGEISLHRKSERRGKDSACPAQMLPKQGVSPP